MEYHSGAKYTLYAPLTSLPTPVANDFKKTSIGWIQALMGLIAHDWAEIQNSYLRSLGPKISGQRLISSLIRKLWNTSWDIWNFRNHTLHSNEGPTKTETLSSINTRVTYHYNRGIKGLPKIYHFVFKTNIHTLLSLPFHQCLLWLAATSSAIKWPQINSNNINYPLEVEQLLLSRIHISCLIPSLTTFDQTPAFRTVAVPDKYCRLFIERWGNLPLYQYPKHNQNL